MAKLRKVAVNLTYDCDLEQVHKNVVNFLFSKGEQEYLVFPDYFKIDYYICHPGIKQETSQKQFLNSTVYFSPSVNEQALLNSIKHDWNKLVVQATENICEMFFRSYINSTAMHKNLYSDAYDCVINYSENITKYKMDKHFCVYDTVTNKVYPENTHFIENNLFYCDVICPMYPELDYSFFVTTQSTFNRVILFWQFVRLLDDSSWGYSWWIEWKKDPSKSDADKFILPCWLDMQAIYPRSANGL